MKRIFLLFALSLLVFSSSLALADEGMWLFNAVPKDKINATYGFSPSQQWLDHVRLSSVKFGGGSGSFVSADGLIFTNHHIGQHCIQELSTPEHDYMKTGFYARNQADEQKCPGMQVSVLQSMEDVTAKVNADLKPGMSTAEVSRVQRAAMAGIEKDCTEKTGLRCEIVDFYSGSLYHLYRYKRYSDVRLVFAPEFQMAFFGGDEDNFTFPRYDLDITFLRAYENGRPAVVKDFFRWSKAGAKEGDLIFVSGHPGSTGRWLTEAQRNFLRDTDYPFRIATYKFRIAQLKAFSAKSEENARIARGAIFGLENSLKAITGYNVGLLNQEEMEKQSTAEKKLREAVRKDEKKNTEVGDPWTAIETAMAAQRKAFLPFNYIERRGGLRGDLGRVARDLIRVAAEKQKPNAERLREYRESAIPSLEQDLFAKAPVYRTLEVQLLTAYFQQVIDYLKPADPAMAEKLLAGRTPEQRAEELIAGTKLDDVDARRKLYEGGQAAIDSSNDSLIVFWRQWDADARKYRKIMDDEVDAVERREGSKIARLQFEQAGMSVAPDANSTLRLSYGAVKSYVENGKKIAAFTTIGGAFERAGIPVKQNPDLVLPVSWTDTRTTLKLKTPLNFASTADIIGGNSGSPVINKDAEIVGIIFDGNIQSLPWRFYFEDKIGRAVSVDSRGIQEALRSIYRATPLDEELVNGKIVSEIPMSVGK